MSRRVAVAPRATMLRNIQSTSRVVCLPEEREAPQEARNENEDPGASGDVSFVFVCEVFVCFCL